MSEKRSAGGVMCGIAGVYRFGEGALKARTRAEDSGRVLALLRAIEYRGPDDEGLEKAGRVTFGTDVVRRWHDEHRRQVDRSGALWAALSFELWWREIGAADAARLIERGRPLRPSRVSPVVGARS